MTPPPHATLSDLGPFLLTLTNAMLTTTLRLVEELGPALASWSKRFLVLSENLGHELTIRVRLGLLGPIVLDPIVNSLKIMPVAALALHAILALCTAHSSPELQDLYTYLNVSSCSRGQSPRCSRPSARTTSRWRRSRAPAAA